MAKREFAIARQFLVEMKVRRSNRGTLQVWVAERNDWLDWEQFRTLMFSRGMDIRGMVSPVEASLSPREEDL